MTETANAQGPVAEDRPVLIPVDQLSTDLRRDIARLQDEYGQLGLVKAMFSIYPSTVRDVARWLAEEEAR